MYIRLLSCVLCCTSGGRVVGLNPSLFFLVSMTECVDPCCAYSAIPVAEQRTADGCALPVGREFASPIVLMHLIGLYA